jgi:hypothetical protein
MPLKDVLVWLFARNTKKGSQYLHGTPEEIGRTAVRAALDQVVDSRGRLVSKDGKWSQGDLEYTVNPTNDPQAPGGYYLSISWPHPTQKGQREHTTIVFTADGYIADATSNRKNGWL